MGIIITGGRSVAFPATTNIASLVTLFSSAGVISFLGGDVVNVVKTGKVITLSLDISVSTTAPTGFNIGMPSAFGGLPGADFSSTMSYLVAGNPNCLLGTLFIQDPNNNNLQLSANDFGLFPLSASINFFGQITYVTR